MTIYDIAKALGVSAATVSLALNGDSRVAAKTRERVLEYAKKHDFKRNEQARNFRLRRTNNIALVVHNIDNDFWFGVVRAIEVALGDSYNVILCNTEGDLDKEYRIFANLIRRNIDGIIVQPASREEEHLLETIDAGVPVVLLEESRDPRLSFVKGNDFEAAKRVTEECMRLGHHAVCHVSFRAESFGLEERIRGFREAAGSGGEVIVAEELTDEAVEAAIGERLKDFTLLLCSDDRLACIVMRLLQKRGIPVPEALSVVGWNDSRFLEYLPTPLSSVRIPMKEAGRIAAEIILRNLNGKPGIVEKRYVEEKLIFRDSFRELK